MKAVEDWLKGVERWPVEQQGDLAEIDNRSPETRSEQHAHGATSGAIVPLQKVQKVRNVKSKDRVHNLLGTPQEYWRAQQAHSGNQRKLKRRAAQASLPSKRVGLGRGTWEDPVLID